MQIIMIMLGNYYQKHAAFFVVKGQMLVMDSQARIWLNTVIGNSKKWEICKVMISKDWPWKWKRAEILIGKPFQTCIREQFWIGF